MRRKENFLEYGLENASDGKEGCCGLKQGEFEILVCEQRADIYTGGQEGESYEKLVLRWGGLILEIGVFALDFGYFEGLHFRSSEVVCVVG